MSEIKEYFIKFFQLLRSPQTIVAYGLGFPVIIVIVRRATGHAASNSLSVIAVNQLALQCKTPTDDLTHLISQKVTHNQIVRGSFSSGVDVDC